MQVSSKISGHINDSPLAQLGTLRLERTRKEVDGGVSGEF